MLLDKFIKKKPAPVVEEKQAEFPIERPAEPPKVEVPTEEVEAKPAAKKAPAKKTTTRKKRTLVKREEE